MVTAQLSRLGIKVTRMWTLDARSRYQQEIEELRESINEIRLSQVHADAEGLDVGWDAGAPAKRNVRALRARSLRELGTEDDDGDDGGLGSIELAVVGSLRVRSDSDAGVVENPVHE
jgi:thioesterase domain-containing protein